MTIGTNDATALNFETNNTTVQSFTSGGAVTFQNASNSTSAFSVQNAAGTSNLLIADTTNTRIAIAQASAAYTLDVNGDINTTGDFRVDGTIICTSGGCTPASGSSDYVQLQGSTPGSAQTGHLNISGTAIAGTFSGSGASLTSLNASNISSGSLDDARLSANVALLNGTGPQTFTSNNRFNGTFLHQNASNSTTAFQIQNAAGSSNLFNADTTNSRIGIGLNNPAYTLDVAGDVNVTGVYRISGTAICTSGGCTPESGSNNYVQLQGSTPGSAQTGHFNITGTGKAANFDASTTIKTNGTTRIDSSGNLTSIGNVTTSGASTFATTGATGFSFRPGTNNTTAFNLQNATGTTYLAADSTNMGISIGDTSAAWGVPLTLTRRVDNPGSGNASSTLVLQRADGSGLAVDDTADIDFNFSYAGTMRNLARVGAAVENATDGTRAGYIKFSTVTGAGSMTERARITSVGQLQLATQGSTGGLMIGSDANLYRSAADTLKTDDAFVANGVDSGSGLLQGTGGLTLTGTTNINTSGSAATTIGGSTGQLQLNSANTSASAIDLNATGIVAGNAITMDTTDGGIALTAAGASNGDISLAATDDISIQGTAGSLVNIGTSAVSQTVTIGASSGSDLALQDANWSVTGAGAITTTNNISTTGTGTITSAGLLTGSAGLSISGGDTAIVRASSTAFTVANTGTTYGFQVDESVGSAITGVKITARTSGNGVNIDAISNGSTNEALILNAKGSGNVNIANTSTGNVNLAGGSGTTGCTVTNSNGNLACDGTYNTNTFTGSALTFGTASTATIQPASSQALTITAHGTSTWSTDSGNLNLDAASALNLGGTNATSVTLGNTTNTTSIVLQGAAAATYTIGNTNTTGTITLGQSTASNTISIGSANPSSATQTISIGNGAASTSGGVVLNLANGTPGASTTNTINIGSGGTTTGTVGITIGSNGNAAHTTAIQGGSGATAITLTPQTTGQIVIGASGGTGTITLGSSSGAQTVNIANGSGAGTVAIANVQTGGSVAVGAAMTTGTITIGGTGAQTGTISVGTGTGAQSLNFGTGGTGAKTVVVGSTASTGATTVQSGSGNVTLEAAGSSTTGRILVGAGNGGAGSTTPDLLGVDVKSATGDPTGFDGAIYYNTGDNQFRAYNNGAWYNLISAIDVRTYTSDDTWTKPAGATMVQVIAIGAGGGGWLWVL